MSNEQVEASKQKPEFALLEIGNKLYDLCKDGAEPPALETVRDFALKIHSISANMMAASPETKRFLHEKKLSEDPDYKERFEMTTIPVDRVFTVVMKCVDRYESDALMASMFAKDRPLVAGCSVQQIDYANRIPDAIIAEVVALAEKLTGKQLV